VNACKVLGLVPGIITALFDLTKGLLAMYLAHLLGTSPLFTHMVGFAAIIGHCFPFYLNFRGGQGVAIATSIMIYYLILFYKNAWLPWDSLLLLAFCVGCFIFIARKGEIIGLVILPTLGIFVLVFSPHQIYQILIQTVIAYILFINLLNIRQEQLLRSTTQKIKDEINWRFFLRPAAVLLIINYFYSDKIDTLVLIGVVVLLFLALDLLRLFSKNINVFFFEKIKKLYKSKEYQRFSSITLFLVASFLTVLLFEKPIAILAVSFIIFGDFFSKFFGLHFGRTEIFDKSLQGCLAHLCGCLISGYIFLHYFSFPVPIFLTGAVVATIVECLPLGIDDNFSVGLISASTMYVFQLF
jgi:glycerol-3-phosphate acyltransferase PlsY